MEIKSALFIFGCHEKRIDSSAYILGNSLSNKLQEKMVHTELRYAGALIRNKETLISTLNDFDAIVISCPEKFDVLPSDIIELMDILWAEKEKIDKEKTLILLMESVFPVIEQNNLAVKITRNFSEKMRFKWLGALCFSQSGIIKGNNLNDIKNKSKRIIKAIEILAENISEGRPINARAYELVNKKIMPVTSYTLEMKRQWKKEAKKELNYSVGE